MIEWFVTTSTWSCLQCDNIQYSAHIHIRYPHLCSTLHYVTNGPFPICAHGFTEAVTLEEYSHSVFAGCHQSRMWSSFRNLFGPSQFCSHVAPPIFGRKMCQHCIVAGKRAPKSFKGLLILTSKSKSGHLAQAVVLPVTQQLLSAPHWARLPSHCYLHRI